MSGPSTLADLHAQQPPEWPSSPLGQIKKMIERSGERLVVLDDDPTGTQTVHDVPVVTTWREEVLAEAISASRVVFVLTNSRSLTEPKARSVAQLIGRNITAVGERLGAQIRIASRSDSTLRGHFPAEVDALADALGERVDGILLCPAFPEGGRITCGDIHWVADGSGEVVSVAHTPFAQDPAFGFASSRLPEWVEEKSGGNLRAADVVSVGIDDIRTGGPERVAALLETVTRRGVAVINALSYRDLEVAAAGTQLSELRGRRFIYRCAAGFVRARGAISARPLLRADEIARSSAGTSGLVVCGSHVPLATIQVERALSLPSVVGVELPVEKILENPRSRDRIARRCAEAIDGAIRDERTALLHTSRDLFVPEGTDPLEAGRAIMETLVGTVRMITERPAFVVGKGGITSSDLATEALGIERATVLGQIRPGVPVWRADRGPARGQTLVIVPGNVGTEGTLADIIVLLTSPPLRMPRPETSGA